jgi:hypothetical protein
MVQAMMVNAWILFTGAERGRGANGGKCDVFCEHGEAGGGAVTNSAGQLTVGAGDGSERLPVAG